jgi:hypothetical protein
MGSLGLGLFHDCPHAKRRIEGSLPIRHCLRPVSSFFERTANVSLDF